MTSALQKSRCCSATSAAQHSENCSATSVFACAMLQGWGLEGWGLGLAHCVGTKESFKIPAKFPCKKSRKIHRRASAGTQGEHTSVGDRPNTVLESTVSNTELSEFFGPRRVPGTELSEFLLAYHLCAKPTHRVFRRTRRVCRNSTLETVFRPFPKLSINSCIRKF